MSIVPYPSNMVKWTAAKQAAAKMAARLAATGNERLQNRAWHMSNCANRIEYTYCNDCGSLKIARTNLCRDRLCPLCAWRLSLQRIGEMMQCINALSEARSGRPISAALLTLTVKNCSLQDLSKTLSMMLDGWSRLTKRRSVAAAIDGYARSVEITRGRNGSYHPHIHALIIWREDGPQAIPQRELCDMWAQSCAIEYTPIVDIRSAYGKKGAQSRWDKLVAATLEATKYALKPAALSQLPIDDIPIMAAALASRRLIAYGGCLAKIRKQLRLTDSDSPTSIEDTTIDCPKCGSTDTVRLAYIWAADSAAYQLADFPYSGGL